MTLSPNQRVKFVRFAHTTASELRSFAAFYARRYVLGGNLYKNIYATVITLLLFGCSDGTPMKITDQNSSYVGVWQYRFEKIESNSIDIDNLLVVINHDGTAAYRRCVFNEAKSKYSQSHSSSSVSYPEAVVTKIEGGKITLVQKLGWFGFSKELRIDKIPYQENGNWYFDVEGRKLVKLLDKAVHTETNWDCHSNDEQRT